MKHIHVVHQGKIIDNQKWLVAKVGYCIECWEIVWIYPMIEE